MTWTAYHDECESAHPGHAYSMATSLIEPADVDDVADTIHSLMLPGTRKLHWYDEHKPSGAKLPAGYLLPDV